MATRGTVPVAKAVARLKKVNVQLLAIDFDQTLVDIHTGGNWQGNVLELISHVRPEFVDLISAAMGNDIHVAIVTFSRQPAVIRNVLEHVLGNERAAKIPIRGGDRSWSYQGGGSKEGKQAHMASAVEELEQSGRVEITKGTTVLIDDDKRNIRVAIEEGVRAVYFNPNKPHQLYQDLENLP